MGSLMRVARTLARPSGARTSSGPAGEAIAWSVGASTCAAAGAAASRDTRPLTRPRRRERRHSMSFRRALSSVDRGGWIIAQPGRCATRFVRDRSRDVPAAVREGADVLGKRTDDVPPPLRKASGLARWSFDRETQTGGWPSRLRERILPPQFGGLEPIPALPIRGRDRLLAPAFRNVPGGPARRSPVARHVPRRPSPPSEAASRAAVRVRPPWPA